MTALFLLDTNIVSNLRRARPHPNLVAWLSPIPPGQVFMAAVTVAEIQCGVGQAADPTVADRVQRWLDGLLEVGQPQVVPFDTRTAVLMGRMWATPALNNFIANDPRSRKVRSGADLAIAATAIAHDLVVATANTADFLAIGALFPLPGLIDPFAPTEASA